MEDNDSNSLSKALLRRDGLEGATSNLSSLKQGSSQEIADPGFWPLLQRSQTIKFMLDEETLSHQRSSLGIEKIDQILTTILSLEANKPHIQRLNSDEIIYMASTILKKTFVGDRLEMVLSEVRKLENQPELKLKIMGEMEGFTPATTLTSEPSEVIVSEATYDDIMELQVARLIKPTLSGHTRAVTSIVLTPDNRFIISGSRDTNIKIWNIETWSEEFTLTGHTDYVETVAVTPDGQTIVSGSFDNTVRIWSIVERKEKHIFIGHTSFIISVVVSADGRLIVSGSSDCTIKIWSMQELREEFTLAGHRSDVNSVSVTSDSKYIVSGSGDTTIRIWSILERREEYQFAGHTQAVRSIAVSLDNKFIVSGSEDHTVKVWNLQERKEECTFVGHTREVWAVAVSPDCEFIVSGDVDSIIKIWSAQHLKEEYTLTGQGYWVWSMAVSADSRFILTGCDGGVIRLWKIQKLRKDCIIRGHNGTVSSVRISSDRKFMVSGSEDRTIKIYNIQEEMEKCTLNGHSSEIFSIALSNNGRFIASASGNTEEGPDDCNVRIWNTLEQREECVLVGHTDVVKSVAISHDSRFIVSGSYDKTIRIWSVLERKEECKLTVQSYVLSVSLDPESRLIVSGSYNGTISIWNIQEQEEVCILTGHTASVVSVTVSPDGRFIVSGSEDKTIRIWSIQEQREECILNGHENVIRSVTFSSDGRFIVSGSEDYMIKIWSMKERREECTLIGHTSYVCSVAVSLDCKFIVSGSSDRTIRVWNMPAFTHAQQAQRSITTSDGIYIISRLFDNKVQIWNSQTKNHEKFTLQRHGSLLKYIIALSNRSNRQIPYQIFTGSDFLVIKTGFEITEIIYRENGKLQFFYDLGSMSKDFVDNYDMTSNNSETIPLVAIASYDTLRFTLAHYYGYLGNKTNLQKLLDDTGFIIKADAFSKSPFYYAILKKRQDCVDVLLEGLEAIRVLNLANYELSLFAIRNDFSILIKNSPRQLHQLLSNLIITREQRYAKVSGDFPILQEGLSQTPCLLDFPCTGSEEIPIILQHSRFSCIGENGCMNNTMLLDAIINCKNSQALRCPIIRYIVELQFNGTKHWVIAYTLLLSLNIFLLMMLIGLKTFDVYLVISFLFINTLLFTWELVQMITEFKVFFQDPWNYLDIIRNLASVVWVSVELYGISSLYFTWTVALMNFLRGITVFRLFDGTRFYIDLIFSSLNDIKYFFLMFAYSTFTFGCLLMISRAQTLSFTSVWGESYDLNFGNYEDTGTGIYFMQYIVYFGATVINVVLMLNLLISILGDSYERFQLEQNIVDIKEKARISMELQSMMFWASKSSQLKCIRLCSSAFEGEEDQDWEGRIRFMDKKLDKGIRELTESNLAIGNKINESSKLAEVKSDESNKSIENKIDSIESKITDLSLSLENKISEISVSFETRIKESNEAATSQIRELSQKLEEILNILSK